MPNGENNDAGPKAKDRQGLFVKSCLLSLPTPQSLAQLPDSRHLIKSAICQVSIMKLVATPSPAFPLLSGSAEDEGKGTTVLLHQLKSRARE